VRQNLSRGDRVVSAWGIGYVAVGVSIATAVAWPIYATPRLAVIAAVAMASSGALVLLSRFFGWRRWGAPLASVGLYLVMVVPLAIPSALVSPVLWLRGIRDGVAGIVVGWKQLLTLSLPMGGYQAVLVPFLLVIFFGSLGAVALAARNGRWAPLAAVLVVLMSAFGVVFGSSSTGADATFSVFSVPAPRQVLLGTALVLVSLVWLAGRARLTRSESLRVARAQTRSVRQRSESFAFAARRNALAVGIVAIALVAGVAIAPVAASVGPRQALRDRVDPILVLRQQPSPLSKYRSWFASDVYNSTIFMVSGNTKNVGRIRLATLDSYDGEDFHISGAADGEAGRFSRLPRTTPDSSRAQALTITMGNAFSGISLPVPEGLAAAPTFHGARAEQLSDAFYLDSAAASAIDVAQDSSAEFGLEPGDSYTVYADPSRVSISALGSGSAGASLIDSADYPQLTAWVQRQKQSRTAAGLETLIKRLRDRGYLSHAIANDSASRDWISALQKRAPYTFQPSYSGHSTSRIESLFTTMLDQQRRVGDGAADSLLISGVGDDEQFAVAAALLARYEGFESRVVLGTRLTSSDPKLGVAPCASVCTGANVSAWVEVRKASGAWVSFDSTPQFTTAPTVVTDGQQLPKNPTIPDHANSNVVNPPSATSDNSNTLSTHKDPARNVLVSFLPALRIVGLSLLLVLLLVLPALAVAFAKLTRRRRRRDARVPEVSIVGAWDELIDTYVDLGIPMPRTASRLDCAVAAARPAALELAVAVNRAVFAEHPPGRDASTLSWQLVDAEKQQLTESSTFSQRMRARFSPASFLRQLDPASLPPGAVTFFRRKDNTR